MRRNSSHLTVIAGFAVAVILLAAGGLLTWGSAYVHNTVQGQLAAQQIFFPAKAAFAHPVAGMTSWVISGRRPRARANAEPIRVSPPRPNATSAAM